MSLHADSTWLDWIVSGMTKTTKGIRGQLQPVHSLRWCTTHPCLAEEVGDETCAHTSLQSNKKAPQAAAEGFWWCLRETSWGEHQEPERMLWVSGYFGQECTELCHCPYQLIGGQHYSIPFSMHQNATWQTSSRSVDVRWLISEHQPEDFSLWFVALLPLEKNEESDWCCLSCSTQWCMVRGRWGWVDPAGVRWNTQQFFDVGMDQYLLIPFLVGWTSIYQLFWCSPGVQGFDTLPCHDKMLESGLAMLDHVSHLWILTDANLQDLQLKADDRRFYAGLLQVGRLRTFDLRALMDSLWCTSALLLLPSGKLTYGKSPFSNFFNG